MGKEPTGLDPVARRKLWRAAKRLMERAEAKRAARAAAEATQEAQPPSESEPTAPAST